MGPGAPCVRRSAPARPRVLDDVVHDAGRGRRGPGAHHVVPLGLGCVGSARRRVALAVGRAPAGPARRPARDPDHRARTATAPGRRPLGGRRRDRRALPGDRALPRDAEAPRVAPSDAAFQPRSSNADPVLDRLRVEPRAPERRRRRRRGLRRARLSGLQLGDGPPGAWRVVGPDRVPRPGRSTRALARRGVRHVRRLDLDRIRHGRFRSQPRCRHPVVRTQVPVDGGAASTAVLQRDRPDLLRVRGAAERPVRCGAGGEDLLPEQRSADGPVRVDPLVLPAGRGDGVLGRVAGARRADAAAAAAASPEHRCAVARAVPAAPRGAPAARPEPCGPDRRRRRQRGGGGRPRPGLDPAAHHLRPIGPA